MIRRSPNDGFTLVELVVVVMILGVLVLIALPTYRFSVERTYRVTCLSNQRTLNDAVTSYAVAHDEYPAALGDIRPFTYGYERAVKCPKDGTPLVYDASEHYVTCPNHPAL